MKKLFKALILAGLFITYAASTTNAQTVNNLTNCEFTIAVAYADAFCNNTGYEVLQVPASSSATLNIPPGSRIVGSKGYPETAQNCVYYIGRPACTNLPTSDTPNCFTTIQNPCAGYTASVNGSFSIITIQ